MGIKQEVERRWLLRHYEFPHALVKGVHHIKQGYMDSSPGRSFRVRILDNCDAILSVKTGTGMSRREFETSLNGTPGAITLDFGIAVFRTCPYHIRKKRFLIAGGWELDLFKGPLNGLSMLEFEQHDATTSWPVLPPWVKDAHEVTDTLTNFRLSRIIGMTHHLDRETRIKLILNKFGSA